MALEKEALTHKIEDDLAARNRNWDKIEAHIAESVTKVIEEYGGNSTDGYYIKWGNGLTLCLKKVTVNQNIGGSGSAFTTPLPISLTESRVRFAGFSPAEPGTAYGNISNLGNVVASVSTTQWSLRSAETTCEINQDLILFAVSF